MEQKLDGLIDLLAVPHPPQLPSPSTSYAAGSPPKIVEDASNHRRISTSLPDQSDPFPEFSPGFAQADALLDRYRRHLAPQFPFVVVPLTTNAEGLRIEKPFVFRAIIVSSAYDDLAHQRELGKEAIKYLSEHMIVRGEKTLDLLQGILILTSWYVSFLQRSINSTVTTWYY